MDLATLCLAVLCAVLVASCWTSSNVGLTAMAAAWVLGLYVAPYHGTQPGLGGLLAWFPTDLFLTLVGTTLLFAAAQTNGSLANVVAAALRLVRGNAQWAPIAFFVLAAGISAVGAGSIAAAALLAPSAMAVAARLGVAPLLMIVAVAHGAVAGALTPVSPIGVVMTDKLRGIGLAEARWSIAGWNFAAGAAVATAAYLLLGKRSRQAPRAAEQAVPNGAEPKPSVDPADAAFDRCTATTLAVVAGVFGGAMFGGLHLGLAAVSGAALLFLTRTADERSSMRSVPWNVVLMVCGVSMLVKLCETAGSLDLLAKLLGRVATADTVDAWLALVCGGISIFSSTSGVVLPTFLPMVPDVVREVGGGDPERLATAIVVGSNLVDVSPLSTVGALCIAAVPAEVDSKRLFHLLLLWGIVMAPTAALMAGLR